MVPRFQKDADEFCNHCLRFFSVFSAETPSNHLKICQRTLQLGANPIANTHCIVKLACCYVQNKSPHALVIAHHYIHQIKTPLRNWDHSF